MIAYLRFHNYLKNGHFSFDLSDYGRIVSGSDVVTTYGASSDLSANVRQRQP